MSSDLKALSKSEKFKNAERHLNKYLLEIQRHFDFSDFQIVKLLDISSVNFRKKYQSFFLPEKFKKFFSVKIFYKND